MADRSNICKPSAAMVGTLAIKAMRGQHTLIAIGDIQAIVIERR